MRAGGEFRGYRFAVMESLFRVCALGPNVVTLGRLGIGIGVVGGEVCLRVVGGVE